jgi:hypothetical protein
MCETNLKEASVKNISKVIGFLIGVFFLTSCVNQSYTNDITSAPDEIPLKISDRGEFVIDENTVKLDIPDNATVMLYYKDMVYYTIEKYLSTEQDLPELSLFTLNVNTGKTVFLTRYFMANYSVHSFFVNAGFAYILASNYKNYEHEILKVDLATGKSETLFTRNVPKDLEIYSDSIFPCGSDIIYESVVGSGKTTYYSFDYIDSDTGKTAIIIEKSILLEENGDEAEGEIMFSMDTNNNNIFVLCETVKDGKYTKYILNKYGYDGELLQEIPDMTALDFKNNNPLFEGGDSIWYLYINSDIVTFDTINGRILMQKLGKNTISNYILPKELTENGMYHYVGDPGNTYSKLYFNNYGLGNKFITFDTDSESFETYSVDIKESESRLYYRNAVGDMIVKKSWNEGEKYVVEYYPISHEVFE